MNKNKGLRECRVCGVEILPEGWPRANEEIEATPNPDKFYLVYVEGEKAPMVKHSKPECACTEAERLARLPWNHGRKVYILSTVKVTFVEVPQVPITSQDI